MAFHQLRHTRWASAYALDFAYAHVAATVTFVCTLEVGFEAVLLYENKTSERIFGAPGDRLGLPNMPFVFLGICQTVLSLSLYLDFNSAGFPSRYILLLPFLPQNPIGICPLTHHLYDFVVLLINKN